MSAVSAARRPRLVTASPAIAEQAEPFSHKLHRELGELDDARLAAETLLAELELQRPAIIRDRSDEEAEAHDAEMARQRRAIERCDLRRPGLVERIAEAERQEEAEALARRQAEATAVVDAFMADFAARYREHAKLLADLMAEYVRVMTVAASVPGVAGPHDRLGRSKPPELISEATTRQKEFMVYLDRNGCETANRFPAGGYRAHQDPPVDPRTGELPYRIDSDGFKVEPHRVDFRTRTIQEPAKYSEGYTLGALQDLVRLPALEGDEADFWGPPSRTPWTR